MRHFHFHPSQQKTNTLVGLEGIEPSPSDYESHARPLSYSPVTWRRVRDLNSTHAINVNFCFQNSCIRPLCQLSKTLNVSFGEGGGIRTPNHISVASVLAGQRLEPLGHSYINLFFGFAGRRDVLIVNFRSKNKKPGVPFGPPGSCTRIATCTWRANPPDI